MTAEKSNQCYAKLQDIYEQAPVLIDIHSLLVTPSGSSNDSPRQLLAAWRQNLISFLLLEITRKYPVLNMDMLSGKENEYLQKVSSFIESHIDSKSLFFNPHGSVDESLINEKLKEFPDPAPTGDEELITIYQFIPRIASAISLPETAQWRFLYQLSVEWQQQLVLGKFLLLPRQATRELLETFMKGYQNKRQRHHWNAIRWGAEYNRYYQSYLASRLYGYGGARESQAAVCNQPSLSENSSGIAGRSGISRNHCSGHAALLFSISRREIILRRYRGINTEMNSKGNVPSAAKPVKDLGGLMRWRKHVKCHYSQKHYVFFILALDTGIAPGKLLKLTWEQIENQTIFDPISGEQLEMTLLRLSELTKAGNKMLIRISDDDAREIKQLRAAAANDVYLFQTETRRLSGIAQPWSQGYVTAFLKESAASSGLQEKVGFLTLQKTWGYQLVVRGNYALSEIQRILGQRSLAATRNYLTITDEDIQEL